MRKWMSERFKRRKKATEKPASEAAPVPLQPKYFDSETKPAAPAPEAQREPPERELQEEPSTVPEAAEAAPSQAPGNGDAARRGRRRRRGRGGRGRGTPRPPATAAQSAQAIPAQPVPPVPESDLAAATPSPVPAPVSAAPRASKGTVVLAIGLPGSGKSSWFKRHKITPLSSDLLRAILFDDPTEQRFQDLVFSNLRSMLRARLIARRPLSYVDATNLTPHERQNWIKLAQDYEYEVQAVFFDVPLDVCLERNRRRERAVPEDIVRRMAAKLRPPTFEEGFAKITVVKVKKKETEPQ